MIQLYGVSNIFGAVTNLAIALFVYLKGRGKKLAKIWSIFTLCVAIYGLGAFMAASAKDYDSAFLWWQISYVGVILLPVLFLHFVYVFLGVKRPVFLKVVYVITCVIWITNLTSKSLFIGNVSLLFVHSKLFKPAWWVYPPGPLHIFHTLFLYFGLLAYAFVRLIKAYKFATPHKRTQIKYFSIAMLLGFVGGGTSYLPCFGINLYPIFNITVPLYTFIIAYTIIRHQLMDIEVIIRKTIVFAGLFLASYTIFAGFAFLGSSIFENFVQNRWIAMIPSIFVIVLVLRPLENFLKNITDKYLFQKKYDYRELLRTFSDEVITELDLEKLVDITVNKLAEVMKLSNASIMLYDEGNEEYRLTSSAGTGNGGYALKADAAFVKEVQRINTYVSQYDEKQKKRFSAVIQEELDKLKAVLIIPLMHQNDMVGILFLGSKKSDEEFIPEDIDILLPLAKTLSIAITNAQLFVKLSQAQAQAAQREKMAVIGTLSAGINHEICNPLGIARGQCEVFLLNLEEGFYKAKGQDELVKKAQEIMGKVINEVDRATVITKKLSSFAKPSKDEITDNVSVEKEMDEVIALVEHDLSLDGITITKDIEKGLPCISADRKQIQEIFFNIVRNASQSIEGGGTITVRMAHANNKVYIDIRDTGSGISKGNLTRIFDPFFTTKEPGKGTGLGLFIVKQIVERNNGTISVESELGKGTVFHLVFKVSRPKQAREKKRVKVSP